MKSKALKVSDKVWDFLFNWSVPIYVFLLSCWAATANTVRRIRKKEIPHFSIREWVGDIVISSFIGVLTFHLCRYTGVDDMLMAVYVGAASHMGTRALSLFERIFSAWIVFVIEWFIKKFFPDFTIKDMPTQEQQEQAKKKLEE